MINSLICKVSKNVPRHLSGSLSRLKHGFDSRGGHQLIRSFSRIRGHLYRSGVLALSCVHCVAHVNYDHRLRDQHRGTDLTVNRNNAVRTDNFFRLFEGFSGTRFLGLYCRQSIQRSNQIRKYIVILVDWIMTLELVAQFAKIAISQQSDRYYRLIHHNSPGAANR